jgi:hypothetical protein
VETRRSARAGTVAVVALMVDVVAVWDRADFVCVSNAVGHGLPAVGPSANPQMSVAGEDGTGPAVAPVRISRDDPEALKLLVQGPATGVARLGVCGALRPMTVVVLLAEAEVFVNDREDASFFRFTGHTSILSGGCDISMYL